MALELYRDDVDLPPEYCHYRDDGCDLAESCLRCPFPRCIYDEPGGRQHWLKRRRDREVIRMFYQEGKGVKELAGVFGVSRRTVQRALKRYVRNPTLVAAPEWSRNDEVRKETR